MPEPQADRDRAHESESELALVRRAVAGAPDAVAALSPYFAKIPAIVAVQRRARRVTLTEADVQDLVQDCTALFWRKLPEFEGRAALSTWLYRLCTLELKNGFRRVEKRRRGKSGGEIERPEPATDGDPRTPIDRLDVEAALARLDPESREIVRQRHFDEKSFDEIATDTNRKASQVKTLYYKALVRLKEWFAARGIDGDET